MCIRDRSPIKPIDVLIVGAGPAGLSAAIRVRERLEAEGRDASVVVIDKAPSNGYHNLSGAAFEPGCLDELLPGWQDERSLLTDHVIPVKRDDMYFLVGRVAMHIPAVVVPHLSLIHISEPTRLGMISYAVFCLKKKK